MMRWLVVMLGVAVMRAAAASEPIPTTPLALVHRHLDRGELEAAWRLLDDLEGDPAVLEAYRGIISLKRGEAQRAVGHLRRSLSLQPSRTVLWLYLGQALVEVGAFAEAVDALGKGAQQGRRHASFYRIEAEALLGAGRGAEALAAIDEAIAAFPAETRLLRDRTSVFLRLGLWTTAGRVAQAYFAAHPDDRDGVLSLGQAMRQAGATEQAAALLEAANLRFFADGALLRALAAVYADAGLRQASASLWARLPDLSDDEALHAAALYRAAGLAPRALVVNARVGDAARRVRQRVGLHVAAAHFERAAALEPALQHVDACIDDARLQLLYGLLRIGAWARAANHIPRFCDAGARARARTLLAGFGRPAGS